MSRGIWAGGPSLVVADHQVAQGDRRGRGDGIPDPTRQSARERRGRRLPPAPGWHRAALRWTRRPRSRRGCRPRRRPSRATWSSSRPGPASFFGISSTARRRAPPRRASPPCARIDAVCVHSRRRRACSPLCSTRRSRCRAGVAVDDEDVVGYLAGCVRDRIRPAPRQTSRGRRIWMRSRHRRSDSRRVGSLSVDTSGCRRRRDRRRRGRAGSTTVGTAMYAMYVNASLADPVDWPLDRPDRVARAGPGVGARGGRGAARSLQPETVGRVGKRSSVCPPTRAPGSPSRRAARSTASPPCAGSCRG